jgi:hypothetical protein
MKRLLLALLCPLCGVAKAQTVWILLVTPLHPGVGPTVRSMLAFTLTAPHANR